MHTWRTKADEDSESAAPITIASSILLMFTCRPKPNKLLKSRMAKELKELSPLPI
jgi:hypothetical protein